MTKFEPATDQYGRRVYTEGDPVFTADRQPIKQGMRVFTNNLDRGTVDLDRATYEWHPGENRWVLWFKVICDTSYKGEPMNTSYLQSDDRVATRFEGRNA